MIGVVRSTDSDTVSYSITAGNEESKVRIEADSGLVTLEEPLNFDRTPSYTLVVEGRDEESGVFPATVTIPVISLLDLCSRGVAVPEPDDNPGLVSDCVTLLRLSDSLGVNKATQRRWRAGVPITSWAGRQRGGSPSRVQIWIWNPFMGDVCTFRRWTGWQPCDIWTLAAEVHGRDTAGAGQSAQSSVTVTLREQSDRRDTAELGNLPNLWSLLLSDNELTGEIPPELGNLPKLALLGLSNNQLVGEIRRSWASYPTSGA